MSLRRLLRIVLSLLIIVLLWIRTAREWHNRPALWITGSLTLSIVLLLVIIMELAGSARRRKQRDDVPKRPLGLDA